MFNVTKAVTIYDEVKMLAKDWDMVPRSVILNYWIKTNILPPFLTLGLQEKKDDKIELASRPIKGSV